MNLVRTDGEKIPDPLERILEKVVVRLRRHFGSEPKNTEGNSLRTVNRWTDPTGSPKFPRDEGSFEDESPVLFVQSLRKNPTKSLKSHVALVKLPNNSVFNEVGVSTTNPSTS